MREILIETQTHSYYQLAIGPNGVLYKAGSPLDPNC